MAFNHVGKWNLEGGQTITVYMYFGNHDDVGAQYIAANPLSTYVGTNNISGNVGWVRVLDYQIAKLFDAPGHTASTDYFVTVQNAEPWGVTFDLMGGGF